MSLLEQKQAELAAKRKSVFAIVEAKPDYNWTEAEVTDFQTGQKELDALVAEVKTLSDRANQAETLRAQMVADDRPAPMPFHSGSKAASPAPVTSNSAYEPAPADLGTLYITSAAFKNFRPDGGTQTASAEVAWGLGSKTTMDTATGYTVQNIRIPKVVDYAYQMPTVADLIPQGTTTAQAIVYMELTTRTNNAAAVAEGGLKPDAALAFTERTAPVRKIAITLPVTDELMADVPAMQSFINSQLVGMLEQAEDTQLITGSGSGVNLTGLLNVSGIQTQATGGDPVPDAIFKAMMKIQTVAFTQATGVLFNPLDWQDVRLLRTVDGIYIWGNPSDPGPQRIWGLPVVTTTALTQNTAVVADFRAMQIFRRQGITLETTNSHSTDFVYNLLRIRAEERLAFAVYRPAAICTVTGV